MTLSYSYNSSKTKKIYPQTIIHYNEELDHVYCEIDGLYYDAENSKCVKSPNLMVFLGQ